MFQYILVGATLIGIILIVFSIHLFDQFQKQLLEVFALDGNFHHKMVSGYRQLFFIFIIGYSIELLAALQGYSGVNSKLVIAVLLFFGSVFVLCSIRFQDYLIKAVLNARMQQVDELTGLLNKHAFESKVRQKLEQQENAYLLVMDLDNFKRINDEFGHMAGDEAIMKAATILRDAFHQEDIVARFGGDEFVAYLYGWENNELSRILSSINDEMMEWSKNRFNGMEASFSIGVAKKDNIADYIELFNEADKAMYLAKGNGKACYFVN